MEIIIALTIVTLATAIILNLNPTEKKASFSVSRLPYINSQLKYQAQLLGIDLLLLFVLYLLNGDNFSIFFSLGNIAAPANGVSWLGIADGESWLSLGAGLSIVISLVTSAFVYLQFCKSGGGLRNLMPFIPWILLFSFTNSFSEEVIYRLGIVVPLAGAVDPPSILLLSAFAFGIPHLRGMPNGVVGVLMASFLGWLLAKSVLETNGIFWAWSIHFLQDVVIFSAFVMASQESKVVVKNTP